MSARRLGQVDGRSVEAYLLSNRNGMRAEVMTYGATLLSLTALDRKRELDDVVLGYHDLEDYVRDMAYLGCIVGRYANRIACGRFDLDGRTYQLSLNDGPNHLHGGKLGFGKRMWEVEDVAGETKLSLNYVSPDGEEGYPGTLTATVTYSLTDDNVLAITYSAVTDRATIVNLTNHSYFNLSGKRDTDILKHILTINADRFTPIDLTLIPTGELRNVAGTPMDFRTPTRIGQRIDDDDEQIRFGLGYDHNFVINGEPGSLCFAARLAEPISGRIMEVWTTEPGLQFYTGNFLDGLRVGKNGIRYRRRHALCVETQHFPDSPNHPHFPSTVLRPGERYLSVTELRFLVE